MERTHPARGSPSSLDGDLIPKTTRAGMLATRRPGCRRSNRTSTESHQPELATYVIPDAVDRS